MKKLKNKKEYTGKEWEELASILSGEKDNNGNPARHILDDDDRVIEDQWKGLSKMNDERNIDVDQAWNNVYSRIQKKDMVVTRQFSLTRTYFLKIAAAVIILASLGTLAIYIGRSDHNINIMTWQTGNDQRNLEISLPDGSHIFLNRNSSLSYVKNFGDDNSTRKVSLTGEAFFDIAPDASKPFTIDAGKASVQVVGTSFNVITENQESAVEVFVKTGKVLLSDNSGEKKLELEPGFIGKVSSSSSEKTINTNPNYMAWNTGMLVYDGESLDVVFRDLKRVYNMNIVADDPSIMKLRWTSPIDYQPEERIILLICTSFNLSYTKDENVYHLAKK